MVWSISTNDKLEPKLISSSTPAPKLLKYSHSTLDPSSQYIEMTSIPQYVAGLELNPKAFIKQIEETLSVKGIDREFLELFEILTVFKLGAINSNETTITKLNKLFKTKTSNTYLYRYAQTDLDEAVALTHLITELSRIFKEAKTKANIILQIMGTQSQPSAELIYYLASLCEDLYIYKPQVVSAIFDMKYLILIDIKSLPKLDKAKEYVQTLSLDIPKEIDNTIQCMNAVLMSKKIERYLIIQNYLKTQIYEGTLQRQLLDIQKENGDKWIETFVKPKGDLLDIKSCELKSVYDLQY